MTLVGRDGELDLLRRFVDGPAVPGAALLVLGEAGVGKSAVIDEFAAREEARGTRVLRAAGVQFEAEVSYSALNQLLLPLGDDMGALNGAHRAALRYALGFELGPAPDRLVVSNAALLWLRAAAAEATLLIVVDDVHWVDRASAEVLSFVARRLVGCPIVFLAACRSAERGFFRGNGLAELTLPPLRAAASRTLLDRHFPELAPAVRHRLLTEAAGNPLALLELPAALDREQREDFTALPEFLPLSDRLRELFSSRVHELPQRCRLMMLLFTLGGAIEVARLRRAGGTDCDFDDLAPAEESGLMQVSTAGLRFRHPLIGAAVVEASSEHDRRWAHGALASVVDVPERRVRHLAGSALGPDPGIARDLEESAKTLLGQGDAMSAVAALTRAADLSGDPADRSRRLAEAAYLGADALGELTTAGRLLDDARRHGSPVTRSLTGAAAAAHLLINTEGDLTTAHRLLAGAIEAGDHGFDADDPALLEALLNLMVISWYVGTEEAWQTFHAFVRQVKPEPPPLLRVNASVFADPARASDADLAALDTLLGAPDTDQDPGRLIRIGTAAVFTDRLSHLRSSSERSTRSRGTGRAPVRRRLSELVLSGVDGYLTGRWDEACSAADEGIALCARHGLRVHTWTFHWVRALVAAGRGEVAAARQLTDDMARWAVAHQAGGITHLAAQARALADLAAGDHDAAYRHAARVSPAGELAPYRGIALWSAFDLVEASLDLGLTAEASAHAEALRRARPDRLSPRLGLVADGVLAMTAANDVVRQRFETALSGEELDRWPFDLARVRLAYGERLRRMFVTNAAREQLALARNAFSQLGAVPWRARADVELRATDLLRHSSPDVSATLTPQDREIAELAGAGLTNRQIGQRLFISHRTVADHLYKIFPKLGINSRAALRDALTAYDARQGRDKPVL
ncbi:AAA family ATPase [Amycolatopsis sp. CA-161197]|uniref:AAA family ATPase n=1 Tax=Amycolatopsis sp. CA-161197 TaxID=3239922 RepID=UPI003D9127B4